MEQESNMQATPTLCRANCGFYGNPATEGMCSVCFKEAVKKKQQAPTPSTSSPLARVIPETPMEVDNTNFTLPAAAAPPTEAKESPSEPSALASKMLSQVTTGKEEKKKPKNRCASCNKKVGLTGFECRCGGLFCSTHRYSDKHDCTFNYRELGAEEIRRNNPVVIGQKIQKI